MSDYICIRRKIYLFHVLNTVFDTLNVIKTDFLNQTVWNYNFSGKMHYVCKLKLDK